MFQKLPFPHLPPPNPKKKGQELFDTYPLDGLAPGPPWGELPKDGAPPNEGAEPNEGAPPNTDPPAEGEPKGCGEPNPVVPGREINM